MDTPESPETARAVNPPERPYRELIELMEHFIIEMEAQEKGQQAMMPTAP
jgi:hypothetical protein